MLTRYLKIAIAFILVAGTSLPDVFAQTGPTVDNSVSLAGISLGQVIPEAQRPTTTDRAGYRYEFRVNSEEATFYVGSTLSVLLRAPNGSTFYESVQEMNEVYRFVRRDDLPASATWRWFRGESRFVDRNLRNYDFVTQIDCEGSTYTFFCGEIGTNVHPTAERTHIRILLLGDRVYGVSATYSFRNQTAPDIADIARGFVSTIPDSVHQADSSTQHTVFGSSEKIVVTVRRGRVVVTLTPNEREPTPSYLWDQVISFFRPSLDAWTEETRRMAEAEQEQAQRESSLDFH